MAHFDVSCGGCRSLIIALLNCVCIGVMCDNSTDKTVLNVALLDGYNPSVHPGHHYSAQLLKMNVSFTLRKIQTFEELTSAFTITGVLSITWYDERLEWITTNYNNLTITHFKQKEIWTPPFVLSNSYDGIDLLGNDNMHIALTYAGVVNLAIPVKLSSSCDADVTYYPFDQQTCDLILLPWGYSNNQIQLNAISSTLDTTQYAENPIWNLVSTVQQSFQTPTLGFQMAITFKRKPLFFVVNFILPTILMCFINMLVFLLPADSGERVGFSVTVLLSIAVFLSIVSSFLPQTSTPQMALLCYMLIAHVILSVMIMVCTIFGLRFYLRSEEQRVPRWIAKMTRYVNNVTKPNTSNVSPTSQSTVSVITKKDEDGIDDGKRVTPDTEVSWKHVGHAFDSVCFVFFLVTALLCNVVVLAVISG
ncbi:acetylcholine receptor subunit beta-type unc-29-like [Mizuhopecten yessoensis]|uniref:Acetylcholine receptor subunit beta-type unc-29 n=1 Tax=Mizuhopecten yessoensis TaxID=6573 RepID=A0A210PYW1_MIZYE|nr:acetylcholine receptor subunit beta-type unc-29-like [Mizuhopecten yessoensis]OWF41680.1 Acetylcholine receptor subunit beta-type unc-29 [Mizuhopecten yessoensis]